MVQEAASPFAGEHALGALQPQASLRCGPADTTRNFDPRGKARDTLGSSVSCRAGIAARAYCFELVHPSQADPRPVVAPVRKQTYSRV